MQWLRGKLDPLLKSGVAGGSFGLAALAGACGGACSVAALPLAPLLVSVGLGGLALWLGSLRFVLLVLAVVFGVLARAGLVRRGSAIGASLRGSFVGVAATSAVQASNTRTPAAPVSSLNPEAIQTQEDAKLAGTGLDDFRTRFNRDSDKV